MRKLILKMHTSLDGNVAATNNDLTWMQPDNAQQWESLFKILANVDLLVLGSGMWEEYRDHWDMALKQNASKNENRYAEYAKNTKHIIFSSSMKDSGWSNAEINDGDAQEIIRKIKAHPGKNIQIVGGAEFAENMIDSGLIDEFSIWINPIILGDGKSIFNKLKTRQELKRQSVESLDNGVVILTYSKK